MGNLCYNNKKYAGSPFRGFLENSGMILRR
jgi:hypothetical protein